MRISIFMYNNIGIESECCSIKESPCIIIKNNLKFPLTTRIQLLIDFLLLD